MKFIPDVFLFCHFNDRLLRKYTSTCPSGSILPGHVATEARTEKRRKKEDLINEDGEDEGKERFFCVVLCM